MKRYAPAAMLLALIAVIGLFVHFHRPTPQLASGLDAADLAAGLDHRISELRLKWVPLREAVRQTAKAGSATINVNWSSLQTAGVDPEQPVELRLYNVTLEQALSLLIGAVKSKLPLGCDTAGGEITLEAQQDLPLVVRVYSVRELVPEAMYSQPLEQPSGPAYSQQLTESFYTAGDARLNDVGTFIQHVVDPDGWQYRGKGRVGYGGPAVLTCAFRRIVVVQTREHQREIRRLLAELRRVNDKQD